MFQVEGLCGNNDGDKTNDLTTSDGLETSDIEAFGESWSLGKCNRKTASDIQPCKVNRLSHAESAVKLCIHVGKAAVFGECRQMVDYTKYRDGCEYDMCARSKKSDYTALCTWTAALARACKEVAVIVNWMSDVDLKQACQGNMP